ncbi:T9SS type A sorting domain-containing protein [bacterium SCSIO 12643]|nr:T9SS type A sorting domain-containing protein [bacterium SCSIO 12643]
MKKEVLLSLVLGASVSWVTAQNSLLQNPTTGALPVGGIINDIEIVSNGTDVVLVAANQTNSEFYAIDIEDNDPNDAIDNNVTEINNFSNLINGATGQTNLTIKNFEVNPITRAIYVLAIDAGQTNSYLIKIEDDGATVNVLDQSSMTYSLIDWNGVNGYGVEDMTFGDNTLYITSGSWTLDGEVATVAAPFEHNSSTTNRATSMFKTNWGGNYFTDAPLERAAFANVNGESRLLGVTVCAPGFSLKTSDITGIGGVLQVREQFNVNTMPPVKVVYQNQDGKDYLFDLHYGNPNPVLIRIGEEYLDGSPITSNKFNNNSEELRDFNGNPGPGMTDEQIKIYPNSYDQIAYWNDCKLLVLENDVMKLLTTGVSASCVALSVESVPQLTGVKVYPNPASDFIQIQLDENTTINNGQLVVYTADGKEALRVFIQGNRIPVDVSKLTQGVYMMNIYQSQERVYQQQLIIK